MKAIDQGEPRGGKRSSRGSFGYWFHLIADKTEPLVEWVIWLCGWSAILFVVAQLLTDICYRVVDPRVSLK